MCLSGVRNDFTLSNLSSKAHHKDLPVNDFNDVISKSYFFILEILLKYSFTAAIYSILNSTLWALCGKVHRLVHHFRGFSFCLFLELSSDAQVAMSHTRDFNKSFIKNKILFFTWICRKGHQILSMRDSANVTDLISKRNIAGMDLNLQSWTWTCCGSVHLFY